MLYNVLFNVENPRIASYQSRQVIPLKNIHRSNICKSLPSKQKLWFDIQNI